MQDSKKVYADLLNWNSFFPKVGRIYSNCMQFIWDFLNGNEGG